MKAIKEYVDEKAEEQGFGDNVLTNIGKVVVNKGIEVALNAKLKVHNYYLWNTTTVRLDGKDQLLSVGVLGQVLTFDKDRLSMVNNKGCESSQPLIMLIAKSHYPTCEPGFTSLVVVTTLRLSSASTAERIMP